MRTKYQATVFGRELGQGPLTFVAHLGDFDHGSPVSDTVPSPIHTTSQGRLSSAPFARRGKHDCPRCSQAGGIEILPDDSCIHELWRTCAAWVVSSSASLHVLAPLPRGVRVRRSVATALRATGLCVHRRFDPVLRHTGIRAATAAARQWLAPGSPRGHNS